MINTEPNVLRDLFEHILSDRANSKDIQALIEWLELQKLITQLKEGENTATDPLYWKMR